MAIVCRKCNYKISQDEINEHYKGFLLDLLKSSIELANNLLPLVSLLLKKSVKENQEAQLENTLKGKANYYKISCSQCFEYNGWIIISDESKDEKEIDQKTK